MNSVLTNFNPWIVLPVIFLSWVLVFSVVKRVVFSIVLKIASKTENQVDDLLLTALDFPVQLLVYASGLLVIGHVSPQAMAPSAMQYLWYGFKIAAIIAGALFIDKFMQGLIKLYSKKMDILRTSGGIAQGFVRLVVLGLGALVLLDTFGISITPIIASLGIGSLAVALALQPTLENFFSGIQLVTDKPIKVGQYVRLESGEEGTVVKIGWRSTWICQSSNNTVIVPNKTLVNSRLINYCYPDTQLAVVVPVGVHYSSDLEKVERVALEVALETLKDCPGAVANFEPAVRFNGFADYSINFNVALRSMDWPSSHLVKHEFIKRLQKRFLKENITIPFPTRTIVQEKG